MNGMTHAVGVLAVALAAFRTVSAEEDPKLLAALPKSKVTLAQGIEQASTKEAVISARGWAVLAQHPVSGKLYNVVSDVHDVGIIDVFNAPDATPKRVAKMTAAAGARTCLYVPELQKLFLAVPHRGSQAAEIRVYKPRP